MPQRNPSPHFQATRHTLVRRVLVREGSKRQIEDDQRELIEGYREPAIRFLMAFRGTSREDAEDHTLRFFAKLFASEMLSQVLDGRVKFRTMLCRNLKNFNDDEWRKQNTGKRGEGMVVTMDPVVAESIAGTEQRYDDAADQLFDKLLAKSHIEHVRLEVMAEMESHGRGREFELIYPRIAEGKEAGTYEEIASELGMSLDQVRYRIREFSEMMCKGLLARIGRFVANPSDVQQEMADLMRALS